MKYCLYCTCMDQLSRRLSAESLQRALGSNVKVESVPCLCDEKACSEALAEIGKDDGQGSDIVLAACSENARGGIALAMARKAAPQSRITVCGLREHCIWTAGDASAEETALIAASQISHDFAVLETSESHFSAPASCMKPVLIVGAGPAGMSAASSLSMLGVPAVLAEKQAETGGMLNRLSMLFPQMARSADVLAGIHPGDAEVLCGTEVIGLAPTDTGFEATLKTSEHVFRREVAAVVLATGGLPLLPGLSFRYSALEGVSSQISLEARLSHAENGGDELVSLPSKAVFIQCVHARSEEAPYCSAVCCPTAVKNAIRLKLLRPAASVTVVYKHMHMPGIALEEMYRKARSMGVRFVHVDSMESVQIEGNGHVESVVLSTQTGDERLPAEEVVCSTPVRPVIGTAALARQLGIRMDSMRFLLGHGPMHPLGTDTQGVFICGSARYPLSVEKAIEQGRAAAVSAVKFLHRYAITEAGSADLPAPAHIEPTLCSGCGRCVVACPHGACRMGAERKPVVHAAVCQRCGVCGAVCPCGAAQLPGTVPGFGDLAFIKETGIPDQRRAL